MSVKIVTNSASYISPEIAKELGIVIILLSIVFGAVDYRDGIDITPDAFYHKLTTSSPPPITTEAARTSQKEAAWSKSLPW